MSVDIAEIKIAKWEKFNPRADRGNFAWFRFQNSFFTDQAVFGLTGHQKLLFMFLCCEASRNNAASFSLNLNYASALLTESKKQILSDLAVLVSTGLVEHLKDSSKPLEVENLGANGTERNVRNGTERDGTEQQIFVPPEIEPETLASLWNDNCGELPKVQKLSPKRKVKAASRLKAEPSPEYWESVIKRIAASDFCNGDNNSGWKADFDFLVQPDTHLKALEGKYDNRLGGSKTKQQRMSDNNQRMFDAIERGEV